MSPSAIAFPAILLLVCAILLRRSIRVHRIRLTMRVRKLYASRLFQDLQFFLRLCNSYPIDQLTVSPSGLHLRYYSQGAFSEVSFDLESHGYSAFSTEQLEAMRSLLEREVDILRDGHKYAVITKGFPYTVFSFPKTWYYSIRSSYKAAAILADDYEKRLFTESR